VEPVRYIRRFAIQFLSLLFLIAPKVYAADVLRVSETQTKVELRDQAMLVQLGIENLSVQRVSAHIEVELLDPKGETRGMVSRDDEISRGSSRIPFKISMPNLKPGDIDSVFWYRMRYSISPAAPGGASFEPVTGILSISEIAPDMFELQLAHPMLVKLGGAFQAIVRAVQPVTSRPVSGVKVQATLDPSDTDSNPLVKASATTDSRGYATVNFVLPAKTDTDDPTITIKGQRGSYTATLDDEETHTSHFSTFLLNTDKPYISAGADSAHTRPCIRPKPPRGCERAGRASNLRSGRHAGISGKSKNLQIRNREHGLANSRQRTPRHVSFASRFWRSRQRRRR